MSLSASTGSDEGVASLVWTTENIGPMLHGDPCVVQDGAIDR